MLHHHGREEELTEAEREMLLREGAAVQGTVMGNEPCAADHQVSRVRVCVTFKDGQTVEFSEELASLYQPAPGSPEARRLAEARGLNSSATRTGYPRSSFPCSPGRG